jgi:hypothetical protein
MRSDALHHAQASATKTQEEMIQKYTKLMETMKRG